MSDEIPTLGEYIDRAVREWADANGGGIATGFASVVEYIDADGQIALITSQPGEQPVWKSLGMASWLNEWFRDDARNIMYACLDNAGDDD